MYTPRAAKSCVILLVFRAPTGSVTVRTIPLMSLSYSSSLVAVMEQSVGEAMDSGGLISFGEPLGMGACCEETA